MQLQEQVITKQQSEKLKALWFNSDSLYWYTKQREDLELKEWYLSGCRYFDSMSAYTASELMDILPETIYDDEDGWDDEIHWKPHDLLVYKDEWKYYIQYANSDREENYNTIHNTNLTQALWDMLIYLLENNLLPNQDK